MTQEGSHSSGQSKRGGRRSILDARLRQKVLLSIWFGRENEYLRPKDIEEDMSLVCGASPSWTKRNLGRMVNDGRLEKEKNRYRPTDYYVEFSPAVPIRLMEESPTFLSTPLSPYNWITVHGLPGLEEMTLDESRKFFTTMLEMEESLSQLYLLRAEVAVRLGHPQVAKNLDLLKDDVIEYILGADQDRATPHSPASETRSESRTDSPSDAKRVADLQRGVWLSKEWEKYVETPLVASFSVLSQILEIFSRETRQETAPVNFQFYSYVFRLLEIASTLWRTHLEAEGRDKGSIDKELSKKGLDQDGIEKNSMSICRLAFRKMLKKGREDLDEKRKTLKRILRQLRDLQKGSAVPKDLETEVISLRLAKVLGPVAVGPFLDRLLGAVESYRAKEGSFPSSLLRRITEEALAEVEEKDETYRYLDSELYEIDNLDQFRYVTFGFMAPFPDQLESWELDLMGFSKRYFPPGFLAE